MRYAISRWIWCCGLVAGGIGLLVFQANHARPQTAQAQEPAPAISELSALQPSAEEAPGDQADSAPKSVHILRLKSTHAPEVAELLNSMFGGRVRVHPESHTNSLLVFCNEELFQEVQRILEAVDVEGQKSVAQLQVFSLRHMDAQNAYGVVQGIMKPGDRIAVDERTNSLVVSGDEQSLQIAQALLLKLDQPPEEKPAPVEDKVVTRSFKVDKLFSAEVFSLISEAHSDRLRLVMDADAQAIVASGKSSAVEQLFLDVRDLEQSLAAPAFHGVSTPCMLRVVWLTMAVGDQPAVVPPDLEGLAAQLENRGIRNLTLVNQLYSAFDLETGQPVQSKGSARIGERLTNISMRAIIKQANDERAHVEFTLETSAAMDVSQDPRARAMQMMGGGGGGGTPLAAIQGGLSLPINHPVVLGVTPVDGLEQVFIVQIIPDLER